MQLVILDAFESKSLAKYSSKKRQSIDPVVLGSISESGFIDM